MARTILIASGKGGTGKTTLASNLAYSLAEVNQRVFVIDANLTTPNLGIHLGFHLVPITLHDILKGKYELRKAIYYHPSGMRVIPGSLKTEDLIGIEPSSLTEVVLTLLPEADFIILDGAAGLGRETIAGLNACDEVILISNPSLPSVIDGLKLIKVAESLNKKVLGVVVNRISKKNSLSKEKIEEILGQKIIAEIPEDPKIPLSISYKKPLLEFDPYSPAALEIRKLGYSLVGKEFKYPRKSLFKVLISKIFG